LTPAEAHADTDRRTAIRCAILGAAFTAAVSAVCAGLVFWRLGGFGLSIDDSYIYTGYVKMVQVPGAGLFSYNVGEHSAGTTSILFYYLSTASYALLRLLMLRGATSLELNAWLVSGTCLIATGWIAGWLAARLAQAAGDTRPSTAAALTPLTIGGLCISERFLWGTFSGMENPLSGLLVTALASVPWWRSARPAAVAALAAALIATRPESAPIVALVPALSLLDRGRPLNARLSDAARGYTVLATCLLAMFIPLWYVTGTWQPSAHGARVEIHLAPSAYELVKSIWIAAGSQWGLAAVLSSAACGAAVVRGRAPRSALAVPLMIAAFLLMRGLLGLSDLSIRDRYVSYLWAPMLLTYEAGILAVVRGHPRAAAVPVSRAVATSFLLCGATAMALGIVTVTRLLVQDAEEMQQVVVRPSLWMAEHLPRDAVVSMEPAGAIRTFTDFTLVDRVGLTTTHRRKFLESTGTRPEDDYAGFLVASGVQYVFDYPEILARFRNVEPLERLQSWEAEPRRWSLGRISVMRPMPRPTAPVEAHGGGVPFHPLEALVARGQGHTLEHADEAICRAIRSYTRPQPAGKRCMQ
jgi:hypothetical protein